MMKKYVQFWKFDANYSTTWKIRANNCTIVFTALFIENLFISLSKVILLIGISNTLEGNACISCFHSYIAWWDSVRRVFLYNTSNIHWYEFFDLWLKPSFKWMWSITEVFVRLDFQYRLTFRSEQFVITAALGFHFNNSCLLATIVRIQSMNSFLINNLVNEWYLIRILWYQMHSNFEFWRFFQS